jgi:hypothetical protein
LLSHHDLRGLPWQSADRDSILASLQIKKSDVHIRLFDLAGAEG